MSDERSTRQNSSNIKTISPDDFCIPGQPRNRFLGKIEDIEEGFTAGRCRAIDRDLLDEVKTEVKALLGRATSEHWLKKEYEGNVGVEVGSNEGDVNIYFYRKDDKYMEEEG